MTNQVKIGILVTAVWLIVILMFEIDEVRRGNPDYGVDLLLIDYIAFGIFPPLVIWTFWTIRKS